MSVAFVVSGAALGIGLERDGRTALVAGTGADVTRMVRSTGGDAISVDERPDELARVDGALGGAAIVQVPRIAEFVRGRCSAILPFKTSTSLERAARDLGMPLLASPARLVRQLENKLELPGIAAAAGVRAPQTRAVKLDGSLEEEAARGEFDLPAIYQPAVSFAGAGTRLVRDRDDLRELVRGGSRGEVGKLAELVPGQPLCCTGVVLEDGAVLAGPSCHQLTGVPDCTAMPYGSCGNDWTLDQSGDAARSARQVAIATGEELARRGFTGTFGVDVIHTGEGDSVLVEVNPRVTASLSLLIQLQQLKGAGLTLLDAHIAAFLPELAGEDVLPTLHDAFGPDAQPDVIRPAASVILYHAGSGPAMPAPVESGIWRLGGGGDSERLGDGYRIEHLLANAPPTNPSSSDQPADVLLLARSHLRPAGTNAEVARLVFSHGVAATEDGRALTPHAAAAVQAARDLLALAGEHARAGE